MQRTGTTWTTPGETGKENTMNTTEESKGTTMGTNVRSWYMETYPSDGLGEEINGTLTFNTLFFKIVRGENIYGALGVGDSIVRERTMQELARLLDTTYSELYDLWMQA